MEGMNGNSSQGEPVWPQSGARFAGVDEVPGATVIGFIERQAAATPERVAACFGDDKITYRDLNQQAGLLARLLVAAGVEKGDPLPILIDNSMEMIISWIAAMKAGAVFIPLDPAWPSSRLSQLLAATRASICLTIPGNELPGQSSVSEFIVDLGERGGGRARRSRFPA